jgi:hypothetical protein
MSDEEIVEDAGLDDDTPPVLNLSKRRARKKAA